jgi:ribosomal 50S subunit-recycling heat shock protein
MATITDKVKADRQAVRIQLNGTGGQFPTATVEAGDKIEIAFRKNGGTWAVLKDDYQVSIAPSSGNYLVAYNTFVIREETLPVTE